MRDLPNLENLILGFLHEHSRDISCFFNPLKNTLVVKRGCLPLLPNLEVSTLILVETAKHNILGFKLIIAPISRVCQVPFLYFFVL